MRYDPGAKAQDLAGPVASVETGFCYWDWKRDKWANKGNSLPDGTTGIYHFRLIAERFYRWNYWRIRIYNISLYLLYILKNS